MSQAAPDARSDKSLLYLRAANARRILEFHPFRLLPDEPILMRDEARVKLTPKALAVLVHLATAKGQVVKKDALSEAVWPDGGTDDNNLTRHVAMVRRALGDGFIETVPRLGYRFARPIVESWEPATTDSDEVRHQKAPASPVGTVPEPAATGANPLTPPARPGLPSGEISAEGALAAPGHWGHAVIASLLYALACSVPVVLEVAYDFDRLGKPALKLAPVVVAWVLATTLFAIFLDWRRVIRGGRSGLAISTAVIVCAAVVLYLGLCFFLPGTPVTRMKVQSHTAQAAYLHWLRFLVPLAVVFLLVPLHFVLASRREVEDGRGSQVLALLTGQWPLASPSGSFYLSARVLGVLLVIAFLVSIPMTSHIMDNLLPSRHFNLFVVLVQIRLVLYFVLGAECLVWYSWALNRIKIQCAGPNVPSGSIQASSEVGAADNDSNARGIPLSGTHRSHLMWVCVFYAALYAIALFLEVAYGFDRFGSRALALSPFVWSWIFLATWAALLYHWRRSERGRRSSFGLLVSLAVGTGVAVCFATFSFLPDQPLTAMVTPAQTAQAAFAKNAAFYFLPISILVWLIPFHFVCGLNRELARGNGSAVSALLRGELGAVSPDGTVFVRPDWLTKGLAVLGIICVVATQDLLSRLKPAPYQNLFMLLAILRSLCAFAFCLAALLWYRRILDSFVRTSQATQEPRGALEVVSRRRADVVEASS